jgi:hypothetical protein
MMPPRVNRRQRERQRQRSLPCRVRGGGGISYFLPFRPATDWLFRSQSEQPGSIENLNLTVTEPMKAPTHLRPATQRWFSHVTAHFELEQHHLRLLQMAAEAWDRADAARLTIQQHGMVFEDRFGCPRARPEIAIERDSRIAFARLLREPNLADSPPLPPGFA